MQVALITETYPPEVNGVAMTLEQLIRGIANMGHEVQIVRPRQNTTEIYDDVPNISHFLVAGVPLPRYQGLRLGLPCYYRLLKHWGNHQPDVIHVATEGLLGLSALRAAKRLHIPTITSFHTNFHQYSAHYGLRFLQPAALKYLRWVHAHATCTLVPSHDVQTTLADAGFKHLNVLARGVDNARFHPNKRNNALRAKWGATSTDIVVGYVGRVAEEKNMPLTIAAYRAFHAKNPNSQMVVVGDGPIRTQLQKEHPDIHFVGMKQSDELAQHYASLDLFFFASTTETFGNVVTEAMSSGVCVLAYDYAAPQAFITSHKDGLTVAFNDDDAFIEAAKKLAQQPDAIATMGQAAHQRMQNQSWQKIVSQYHDVLAKVCGNNA